MIQGSWGKGTMFHSWYWPSSNCVPDIYFKALITLRDSGSQTGRPGVLWGNTMPYVLSYNSGKILQAENGLRMWTQVLKSQNIENILKKLYF